MNKKKNSFVLSPLFSQLRTGLRNKNSYVILLVSTFIVLSVATYFSFIEVNGFRQLSLVDFEVGKVADRDVVASREISYVDENATKIRRDAKRRLITAVFKFDRETTESMIQSYTEFIDFLENTMQSSSSVREFTLQVQQEYPGVLEKKQIQTLYAASDRVGILSVSANIFRQIANEGLTAFPDEGMEKYNQSDIELVRWKNDRQERTDVPKDSLLTWEYLKTYTSNALTLMKKSPAMTDTVLSLVKPFLKENLIYQADESEAKLDAAVRQVSPVLVVIAKGQKIIKRGFIITEESYHQLEALANSGVYIDLRQFAGSILCLLLITISALYIFTSGCAGQRTEFRNILMLVTSFAVMYLWVLIASRIQLFDLPLDLAVVIPAAFMTMLITLLMDQRTALFMTFILALGVLCASNFSVAPTLFAVFSGVSGVSLMRITGKRIDLVKSACILAAINPVLALILNLAMPGTARDITFLLIGAAINGFMSGILVIGFLPILESALNTSTSFRLMEFSDLNSPIMKKMLLSVSGTYNHSIMVATLAESACREIGADPLLARVGAYYHDIGKMDQSEYFVENQTDYNKHLDLNPRLSATVIRSHVKQGVERARQMRLPQDVIDIISEHHGNSIISYFYNEAKKLNDSVDPEDFTYPGNPPRSKESAVVMLADVVEAACRTLDKPSVPRLEKFISELVAKKIEMHQLDNSELTFKEVEVIKRSFVNILAGYYHTRIEYPNQKDPDAQDQTVRDALLKGKKHE
jgi:putative nucleotidyltransferase with HDIG domain